MNKLPLLPILRALCDGKTIRKLATEIIILLAVADQEPLRIGMQIAETYLQSVLAWRKLGQVETSDKTLPTSQFRTRISIGCQGRTRMHCLTVALEIPQQVVPPLLRRE